MAYPIRTAACLLKKKQLVGFPLPRLASALTPSHSFQVARPPSLLSCRHRAARLVVSWPAKVEDLDVRQLGHAHPPRQRHRARIAPLNLRRAEDTAAHITISSSLHVITFTETATVCCSNRRSGYRPRSTSWPQRLSETNASCK
eukprot:1671470-Pleurochrysis_carterae.AAC.1